MDYEIEEEVSDLIHDLEFPEKWDVSDKDNFDALLDTVIRMKNCILKYEETDYSYQEKITYKHHELAVAVLTYLRATCGEEAFGEHEFTVNSTEIKRNRLSDLAVEADEEFYIQNPIGDELGL